MSVQKGRRRNIIMIQESINSKSLFHYDVSSSAVKSGDAIYISAQLPIDKDGQLISDNIIKQTVKCLDNIAIILQEAGLNMTYVLAMKIYLSDIDDLAIVNRKLAAYFKPPYPAQTVIAVSALPFKAKIQIEAFAIDTRAIELMISAEQNCDQKVCTIKDE